MIAWFLGLPTRAGKTALGPSSPEKPALQYPVPLSMMTLGLSDIINIIYFYLEWLLYQTTVSLFIYLFLKRQFLDILINLLYIILNNN
jgi:hypothetical protein